MSENYVLLLLFFLVAGVVGVALSYLADYLEKRFPWKDHF